MSIQYTKMGDAELNPTNDSILNEPDPAVRRRGRPPKPVERHERELRITPPDGVRPTSWDVAPRNEVSKLVVCEEGGEGTGKQLHYHLVIESTYSDEMIKSWIRKVLHYVGFTLGNQIFRSAKTHERTFGYVVKENTCVELFGYTQEQYDTWVVESDTYRRELETERRNKQRLRSQNRSKQLRTVEERVLAMCQSGTINVHPPPIIRAILHECKESNVDWPTRTQMDNMVNRIRWDCSPQDKEEVVEYYAKSFSVRREYN